MHSCYVVSLLPFVNACNKESDFSCNLIWFNGINMSASETTGRLFFLGRSPGRLVFFIVATWMIVEWLIFSALSRQIGTFGTLAFYIFKGGLGLVLLALVVRRVGFTLARSIRTRGKDGTPSFAAGELFAGILGAILIALPGILPMLAGLALFAPSVRAALQRRFLGGAKAQGPQDPKDVVLDRSEWRGE